MKDVFISYKAEEFEEASWVKSVLEQNGISCWMAPMCIPGGSSYAVEIPQAIRSAKAFVLILSAKSQESRWVSREVDIAINEGKVVLPFMLENCALKDDFNFYLTNVQRYSAYENKVAAMEKMIREIKALTGASDAVGADVASGNVSVSEKAIYQSDVKAASKNDLNDDKKVSLKKPSFKLVAIIVVAVLVVLLAVVLIAVIPGRENKNDSETPVYTTTPAADSEDFEMSDNLFDFTFELLGEVYKLPCSYDKFVENGWTISSTGINSETLVAGSSSEIVAMSKNGEKIFVDVYNYSGNAKKISECKVGGIECEQNYVSDFKMTKGISVDFTPEQVENAFGVPNTTNSGDGYKSMRYEGSSDESYVKFYYDTSEKYSSVTLRNFIKTDSDITETNTERPAYLSEYVAPESLGSDILSGNIIIEGKVYNLPCPLSEFFDDGWKAVQTPGSVVAGGSDNVVLEKDGKELTVYIYNYAKYQTIIENCVAYKVYVYETDKTTVLLPGGGNGISLGMKKDDLEKALTDEFEFYEGSSSYSYSYYEFDDRDFTVSIHVDKESNVISYMSISCETWG